MVFSRNFDSVFIDGNWVPARAAERIQILSPFDEQPIGSVPSANTDDIDAAVKAARKALEGGAWLAMSVAERAQILRRVREQIALQTEELAALMTDEMGCPITQSRDIQVGAPLRLLDDYLALIDDYEFQDLRQTSSGHALVVREPIGVIAAVVPWNTPLMSPLIKIVPALLAGCTVVLKPAPQTTLTAYALATIFADAGLPAGVLNVVPADAEVSEYLVGHPDVNMVAFTGSTGAGRRIASLCGQNLRRVTLELGGKSAGVILDDADMGETIRLLRLGSLRNSGQVCTLKTRLLVSRSRRDEFLDAIADMVSSMPVGDPRIATTEIGPMVTARQRDAVQGYIDSGKSQGARVVVGGGSAPRERGWFVAPTVFADVDPGMRIAQEEIFGPVLSVITYDSVDEAVRIANDSVYGLNGSVYTSDPERGLEVATQIRSGVVEVNGNPIGFAAPFGGIKASGLGREGGIEGLEEYLQPKAYGLPDALWARLSDAPKLAS